MPRALFDLLRALAYATAFVVLWGWLALLVRPLDRNVSLVLPRWSGVGLVLLILGAALALTCVAGFAWWGGGTPAPFDPPRRFVARGPYRFVRNPMYIGGFAVLLGYGLLALSPSILCLSLVMLGCAHLFVVWYEEPSLERRFGEDYRVYRRTVRRWLPRFAGRSRP
jgi:protein-S-isoprenylcysteine O-methyltransferase Ste14